MKKGFTLIELMVTIAVIGLLAAIALPRFSNITKDAEIAQLQANRKNVETALHMYLVKEDREVESLFDDSDMGEGEEFEAFFKYYSKKKLPNLPNTDRYLAVYKNKGDIDPEDIEIMIRQKDVGQTGWIFTEEGNVYPYIEHGRYNIMFNEF